MRGHNFSWSMIKFKKVGSHICSSVTITASELQHAFHSSMTISINILIKNFVDVNSLENSYIMMLYFTITLHTNTNDRKAIITWLVLNTGSFFRCQSGKLKKKNPEGN
jgi:hypothetical protein